MESVPYFNDDIQSLGEAFEEHLESTSCCERNNRCCNCQNPAPCSSAKDIIESIALIESALAHILNAEGEKMQKAVKLACSVDDLLEINKSVRSTLIHATFLEQTLFAKLELACSGCKTE